MDYTMKVKELMISANAGMAMGEIGEMLYKLSVVARGDKQHPEKSLAYLRAAKIVHDESLRILDATLSEIEKIKEELGA